MIPLFVSLLTFWSVTFNQNTPLVEIPFTIEHEHIYVTVNIEGEPLRFAFDTGARANLLDKKVADRLKVKITGRQQVQAVAGAVTMETSDGNVYTLGTLEQKNQRFLLMDLDHLGDQDTPMHGVIGGGIFDNYVVEIDYDNFKIKLFEFDDYSSPSDYERVRFQLRPFGVPVVSGDIFLPDGSSIKGDFLVDTGASLAFSINTPFARQHDLYSRMGRRYEYKFKVLSEKSSTDMARLVKSNILNQTFENMTVRLATTRAGVSSSSAVAGIVGLEVLKRFNTVYDYRRRSMYIKPSQFMNAPFKINYSGLSVKKVGGLFLVEDVYDESAAKDADMRVGDLIKSIDGRENMRRDDFHTYFQTINKPVTLEIVRNNKTIKVRLNPRAII